MKKTMVAMGALAALACGSNAARAGQPMPTLSDYDYICGPGLGRKCTGENREETLAQDRAAWANAAEPARQACAAETTPRDMFDCLVFRHGVDIGSPSR